MLKGKLALKDLMNNPGLIKGSKNVSICFYALQSLREKGLNLISEQEESEAEGNLHCRNEVAIL